MKVLFNYKNHSLMNADLPIGKPNISLCKENSDKINNMHIFYDYPNMYDTEIEYLESTGTQWIDTDYKPNQNTQLKITYSINTITSDASMPFGVRDAGNATDGKNGIFRTHGTNTNRIAFGNGSSTNVNISGYNTSNTIYEVYLNKRYVYIDGNLVTTITNTTWSNSRSIYLFGASTAGSFTFGVPMKIYSCKIWDNDTLVRDYIPVKKNNIGYLFDKVSGQLYGDAGGGNFVCGPDIE